MICLVEKECLVMEHQKLQKSVILSSGSVLKPQYSDVIHGSKNDPENAYSRSEELPKIDTKINPKINPEINPKIDFLNQSRDRA